MGMDVNSVFESPGAMLRVVVLLLALLIVRGLPALLVYPRVMSRREAIGVGLFQSSSLSFPLAAVALGTAIGEPLPAQCRGTALPSMSPRFPSRQMTRS